MSINNSKVTSSNGSFLFTYGCIILSLSTNGLGNFFLGHVLSIDISTLFIFLAMAFQIATLRLKIPKILIYGYVLIILQTFVINFLTIDFSSSFRHFFALVIFSLTIFSFVSSNRNRIPEIVRTYYLFCFVIACIAVTQTVLFIVFGISFIPQNIITGTTVAGGSEVLIPEIFGIIPRAIGLSTEPAHFAILILPGVYIALLEMANKMSVIGLRRNKPIACLILVGFTLSFSIVGYFGLLLCIISLGSTILQKRLVTKIILSILFVMLVAVISQTTLMSKVAGLPNMMKGVSDYDYTVNDLTAFALISNILVANEGLTRSRYLGTGFNTHKDTYAATIYNKLRVEQVVAELNSADAGSLFIRIISELGLPGIIIFVIVLWRHRVGRKFELTSLKVLNNMSLVIIISYSARNGGYISCYLMLFAAIYYYSYINIAASSKYFKKRSYINETIYS